MADNEDRSDLSPVVTRRTIPFGRGEHTRKFFGKSKIDGPDTADVRSNSDFVVFTASGMKIVSTTVAAAAQGARDALRDYNELVVRSIEADEGDNQRGSKGATYDESDLEALQRSFAEAIVAAQGSGSVSDVVRRMKESAAREILRSGASTNAISGRHNLSSRLNKATPDIDYARVSIDERGVIDKFSVELHVTLSKKQLRDESVRALRIFRAKKATPESTRGALPRLSRRAMDSIAADPLRIREKNTALHANALDRRLRSRGIETALSMTTEVDDITGLRHGLTNTSASLDDAIRPRERTISSDDEAVIALSSFIDVPPGGTSIDMSVIDDLKSMHNIQIQNPSLRVRRSPTQTSGFGVVGRDTVEKLGHRQIRDVRSSTKLRDVLVSEKQNSVGYKELAIIPISRLKRRTIGGLIEFTYVDPTVEIGETYTYYVTTIDDTSTESVRSKIVKTTVEDVRPPDPPKRVTVTHDDRAVTINALADSSIEKFEIYRKETDSNRLRTGQQKIIAVGGSNSFALERESRDVIGNGFAQIGESLATFGGSSPFIDRTAVPGRRYTYRIYAVDIFGNKSQDPKEVVVFFNERAERSVALSAPTIDVDMDRDTRFSRIRFSVDDNRVVSFFLERRNLTINEREFSVPHQPSHIRLGDCDAAGCNTFEDTVLRSGDSRWTGHFFNGGSTIDFLDTSSRVDNTYQYRVHGVDRFGNITAYALSNPLFISRRPRITSPTGISAEFDRDRGAILRWTPGDLDIGSEDRLGDRGELSASIVRTLYQVERKRIGEGRWLQFPMMETTELVDPIVVDDIESPDYRPPFLELDTKYAYRIASFQSGGFISNFSDEIHLSTFAPIGPPKGLRVKPCGTKCEPFYVALNWSSSPGDGMVDKWIIERAEVNNFAASKLNTSNSEDVKKLGFKRIATVHRESSRSRSRVDDIRDKTAETSLSVRKIDTLAGDRHYIDKDVRFGNTYFYRVTAVGLVEDNVSTPTIRGIRLTDDSFDRKLASVVTQSERNRLSRTNEPLRLRFAFLRTHGD